MVQILASFVKN